MRLYILYYENNNKIPPFPNPNNPSTMHNEITQIGTNIADLRLLYSKIYTAKGNEVPELNFNEPTNNIDKLSKINLTNIV